MASALATMRSICHALPVKVRESATAWTHLHFHSCRHFRQGICQNKRIQWPAFKIVLLLAGIPMVVMFWHVRSLFQQEVFSSQYCFVSTSGAAFPSNSASLAGVYARSNGDNNNKQKRRFTRLPIEVFTRFPSRWPSATNVDHFISAVLDMSSHMQHQSVMGSFSFLSGGGRDVLLDFEPNGRTCFLPGKGPGPNADEATDFKGLCAESGTITEGASMIPSYWSSPLNEMLIPGTIRNMDASTLNSNVSGKVIIFCPQAAPREKNKKRKRNQHQRDRILKKRQGKKLVQAAMKNPTTHFLIGLNLYLAFYYWNYGTPIQSVAKIYSSIMDTPFEPWRSFTGAFAHFDLMHIGFNMMTMYGVGLALEDNQLNANREARPYSTSLSFLCYNIALVIWTTVIMMLIKKLQISRLQRQSQLSDGTISNTQQVDMIQNAPTIGYSGVLFAWMVVQTLERSETCPIPFLPDMCFQTHEFYHLKWNLGPLVTLGVTQLILRRASFVGHLAGIICGYAIHAGLLPYNLMIVPHVVFPLVLLFYYTLVHPIIGPIITVATLVQPSIRNDGATTQNSTEGRTDEPIETEQHVSLLMEDIPYRIPSQSVSGLTGSMQPSRTAPMELESSDLLVVPPIRKKFNSINPVNLRTWSLLHVSCQMQFALLAISILWGHQASDATITQFLLCCWGCLVVQSYDYVLFSKYNPDEDPNEEQRNRIPKKDTVKECALVASRVFFLCTLIAVLINTMTLSSWMAGRSFVLSLLQSQRAYAGSGVAASFAFPVAMALQILNITLQSFQLLLLSKVIHDMSREARGSGIAPGGVFDNCLGWAYHPLKQIADQALVRELTAFEGHGVALGGGMEEGTSDFL
jgi:membrane associated rhomboid family serine protease